MMNTKDLMQKRFIVTNPYPNSPYKVGDMVNKVGDHYHITTFKNRNEFGELEGIEAHCHESEIEKYSNLFRELHWSEKLTFDKLMSVKYVKVIEYVGYWRVGDIVKVTGYEVNTDSPDPKFISYYIGRNNGDKSHPHPPKCVEPATESEYNEYIGSNKIK